MSKSQELRSQNGLPQEGGAAGTPKPKARVTDEFIRSMKGSLANQGLPSRLERDSDRFRE